MLCIKVLDREGNTVAVERGEDEVNLLCCREYAEGDRIQIESQEFPIHVWLQLDEAIGCSLVYMTGAVQYPVPFEDARSNLSVKAFYGNRHLIRVRRARGFEAQGYRNLARNTNDFPENASIFPHAAANAETRGKAAFAARNAIDGVTANGSHGQWPFTSWGIGGNPDAELTVLFGRPVSVDRIVVYLRADFPHDNWWKRITATFSDGQKQELDLVKTSKGQEFIFEPRAVDWIRIGSLIPSEEESLYPALTQIEVYGTDIFEEQEK